MKRFDIFNEQVRQIAIVGTGLIGASLGLALRGINYPGRIIGVGRRQSTVDRALALGCMDDGSTELGKTVVESQLVVLATPFQTTTGLLEHLAPCDHPDLVITDVGSTKQHICSAAERTLPEPGRFVGSHPMAGSEKQGPEHAQARLFDAKPCVITPLEHSTEEALTRVRALWTMLGMHLIEMSPVEHDRKTACISHLPHALACQLVALAAKKQALGVASTGFRDITRVASGDPELWQQIFTSNRQEVVAALDAFLEELKAFRAKLASNDDERLLEQLRFSKQERDEWIRRIRAKT